MASKNADNSPLIIKYQQELELNPQSRTFAPLAEAYRRLGLHQEALKVLRSGIKKHPSYVMGYLSMAACFFDLKNFEEAYRILRPFVSGHLENIRLQRLFADTCYHLELWDEAFETYKYILFFNPRDLAVGKIVQDLEHKYSAVAENHPSEENSSTMGEEDFWVQKDFIVPPIVATTQESDRAEENWEVSTSPNTKQTEIKEPEQILEATPDETQTPAQTQTQTPEPEEELTTPELFTHTLVDLYCQQKLPHKAIEVLEKILKLMPHDQRSRQRLQQLKSPTPTPSSSAQNEQTDREKLLALFDTRVKKKSLQVSELENKLQSFLTLAKSRARKYQDPTSQQNF